MKNVVRIAAVVVTLLAGLAALPLAAQAMSPNVERGFVPDKAYEASGNIDNVNLFNGNLNLSIPIGQTYRVGGNLSYNFTLYYAGNVWEHATREASVGSPPETVTYNWSYPSRGSNAGMGWRLSFGRLLRNIPLSNGSAIPLTTCSGTDGWAFEGSDGAVHCFYEKLHESDADKLPNIRYSRDDTFLRLHIDTTTVELPDGTQYQFDPATFNLQKIVDVYGNWMAIAYDGDPENGGTTWTITDSAQRTHHVHFLPTFQWRENDTRIDRKHEVVQQVDLQLVGTNRATYTFDYLKNPDGSWPAVEPPLMCDPDLGQLKPGYTLPTVCSNYTYFEPVALLSSITLQELPAWHYGFDYLLPPNTPFDDFKCAIHSATLPTGGKLQWSYSSWTFPPPYYYRTIKDGPPDWGLSITPVCVIQRDVLDRNGSRIGYRTYEQASQFQWYDFQNIVTEHGPLGEFISRTRHHFSACAGPDTCGVDANSPQVGKSGEYSLPVTRLIPPGVDADGMLLSTESLDAHDHVLRRTFLSYESDFTDLASTPIYQTDVNRRVSGSMTRSYKTDGTLIDISKSASSDYDPFGHYRTETTSGNFGASNDRSTYSAFNLLAPRPWPAADPWILHKSLFQTVTATERRPNETAATTTTSMMYTCYDDHGFLAGKRMLRQPLATLYSPPVRSDDLLTIFTRDSGGNLIREEYFGGDGATSVSTTDNCGATGANAYRIDHTYVNGTLQSSNYVDGGDAAMSFKTTDLVLDPATGLPIESHARADGGGNGIVTTYAYDPLGRLILIRPQAAGMNQAEAATKYVYSFNPASASVYRGAAPDPQNDPLTTSTFYFDGIGRLTREQKSMPGGTSTNRYTNYNAAGWKTDVTEWGSSYKTLYEYDVFGRPTKITAPDNSVVTMAYNGLKSTTRTVSVHTENGDVPAATTEEVDRQGRLWQVTDALLNVTQYTYDVGGRLAHVCMPLSGSTCTQERVFNYDMAGLLLNERHPEKGVLGNGTTYYTYDARGHVISRRDGAEHGPFHITFSYDRAERLLEVAEERVQNNVHRIFKHFDFGIDNAGGDYRNGQLTRAVRFNWFDTRNVQVAENYTYAGVGGRPSSRTTSEYECPLCNDLPSGAPVRAFTQGFEYDTLGNEKKVIYPKCTAGDCNGVGGDLAVTNAYDQGLLTRVTFPYANQDQVNNITYSSNGMVHQVEHANHVVDTQTPDPTGMQRPLEIRADAPDCPGPMLGLPQANPGNVLTGHASQLSIPPPSGMNAPQYQWYRGASGDTSRPVAGGNAASISSGNLTQSTSFWVRVTGDNLCNTDSSAVTVTVRTCDSLTITQQPLDIMVPSGTSARFTVTSSDSAAHYQWYRGMAGDASSPVGDGSSSFNTPVLTAAETYWVRVTSGDNLCTVDSASATASVCVPPVIVVQPKSVLLPPASDGGDVEVSTSIEVAGNNVSVAWYEVGQTASVGSGLTLTQKFTGTGFTKKTYYATVTNHTGVGGCDVAINSVQFTLGIGNCLLIQGLTGPVTVFPGSNTFPLIIFMAGADTNPSKFHYDWHHVFNDGHDISLTDTNPAYNAPQITGALNAPYDSYYCVVTCTDCPGAQVTSERIYVHYNGACPLPPLSVTPSSIHLTNASEVFTAYCDWPSVTYQWYSGVSGDTRVRLVTGKTLTVTNAGVVWVRATDECGVSHEDSPSLVVSTAACTPVVITAEPQSADITAGDQPTLHVDAANATTFAWYETGSTTQLGSGKDFAPSPGPTVTTSYYAAAGNSCFSSDSLPATLHVKRCSSVTVSAQPQGGMIRSDDTGGFDLAVTASSAGTISYQWYRGKTGDTSHRIDGATLNVYHAAPDVTTSYWVRMTVTGCSVDSDTAVVTVCVPPHFTNANVAQNYDLNAGQGVTFGVMAAGTGLHYAWHTGSASGPVEGSDAPAIFVRPIDTTVYYCVVSGMCDSITAEPITVRLCATPVIDTAPQSSTVFSGKTVTLIVHATEQKTTPIVYQWHDATTGAAVGTNSPSFTSPPITDTKQYSVLVTAGICSAESATATISVCMLPEIIGSGGDVNAAAGQQITLHAGTFSPPNGNTFVWYRGPVNDLANSVSVYSSTTDAYTFAANASATYWATVSRDDGCVSHTPAFNVNVCVPVISVPPADTLYDLVNPATLSVTATPATSYQWYVGQKGDTSTPVANATSSSISVTPAVDTRYWVRVTSSCTSVDSESALVTHCVPPAITDQPVNRSIHSGESTTLTVYATGSRLHFQWYQGARGTTTTPVGTDAASITVSPAAPADFWVHVSGGCGTAQDSNAAHVSVCTTPSITAQPAVASVFSGGSTTLSVTATESTGEPLHYQWYKNGAPFGTDAATLNTGVLTADTEFFVNITAGLCYVTSNTVIVSICPNAQNIAAPADQQTYAGQSATLIGIANDGSNEYFWYQGAAGDTSHPLTDWLATNQLTIAPTVTTSYWYKVRTGSCISSSGAATIFVCVPQAITQPGGQMVNPNATATLTFTASTPGVTYQWYSGTISGSGTPISGATNSTYTTPPLTTQTSYWCRATSSCGRMVDSNVATITICQPPAVNINGPTSQWVQRGSGNVTLAATGSGTNITWQWYIGNSGDTSQPISFATGSTYVFTPQNSTTFWVRVSGTCGTANSNAVTVNVCAPPAINTQPSNPVIQAGQTATMSVSASDITTTPITYQWYTGASGDTTAPVNGATNASYTTPVLSATTSYWVRVFNGTCTPADSSTATVLVCQPPAAAANQNATVGQSITLTGVAANGSNLYMWFQGNSGDTSHALTGWSTTNSVVVTPAATTNYWYQFQSGSCTSNSGTTTVSVCIPTFTIQPASTMINSGQTATLTAAANTSGVTYQWYNGTSPTTTSPISGATSANYTTPALTSQASYWVRATGSCGISANSNTATVTICQPPAVTMVNQNQWIQRGGSVVLQGSATGSNLTYQWYIGASGITTSPINGATNATYSASPQNTTTYWVKVSGTCGSANSGAVTISVCAPPSITTQPGSPYIQAGQSTTLSVVASDVTSTPVTYQWYLGNAGDLGSPIGGATNASYTTPALNASTNYWVRASNGTCTPADSTTAVVTVCQPAPSPGTYYSSPGQSVTISGIANNGTYQYIWYQGSSGDTSHPLPGSSSSITVTPSVTTNYWYQWVNGNCTSPSGTGTVNVCVPQITTQPADVTVASGSSATLNVAANTAGVTYQWYVGTSGTTTSPINGANGTSLTISPSSTTSYWARATSTCSRTVDSSTATVTICAPTAISIQPTDYPVPYGYTASTRVTASGSNLTYQWYQGESGDTTHAIANATGVQYSVTLTATMRVWVRVSGTCGSVNSNAVWLSVYPTISQQPQDVDLATGATARLTVAANGTLLHYVWRWSNGTAVAGAPDAPTFITPSINTTSAIYCDVTSGTATTRSYESTLTVCSDLYAGTVTAQGTGSCRTLSVPIGGATYYDVYWYKGARGDTTTQVQVAGASIYLCPGSGTAQYWARIYGYDQSGTPVCGYADSQAVTVTVP